MKTSMLAFSLSVCVAVLSCSTSSAQETNEPDKTKSAPKSSMMEGCQQMMKQKQKMMADMQAEDSELTSQMAKMNSAPDDKKMVLLAGIVTELVKQRTVRDASHSKIQEKMMQHMMEHMQMGKESMTQCPMMKDMKDMKGMKGMRKNADTAPKDDSKDQK